MAANAEHDPRCIDEQALLDGFLKLGTPEGYRAEFIEGEVVVSPPPGGDHEGILSVITWQVARRSSGRMDFSGNKGLELVCGDKCTKNHLVPDGVFAPHDLGLFWGAPVWMPSDGVAMVVEVISAKPEMDRWIKRHCYAKAAIPLYLLADRMEKTVCLFSGPDREAEDYREDIRLSFGKTTDIPEPFGFTLETSEFQ
ncbi:Uma2 family endonuclease [Actinomadura rudentiformis]|uniref:Uma2 family endonuclease n=1 Tax=Actinomadura rudentiformis TaxID=359158 RepID=A0A6H9ZAT0_9ACTN|nr:Uma2 family endonuclease [Actinomadura rudentiformis]KAB2351442.1 Uma2 family endonuclease [Actinomadura rudentiformis]